ncbi:MAG: CdaR family protein [Owenweeksia sp.]
MKIFFLLLSVFLWFLIKLSKEGYDAIVEFPVEYEKLPANSSFREMPPDRIRVNLRASGFDILKYQLQSFRSLKVDVSRLEQVKAGSRQSYWLTNSNLNFVESQLNDNVEVRSISPDTVYFDFSKVISKKVPVDLKINKNYSRLISIYKEPQLIPDSVLVTGPEELLSEINTLPTEVLNLKAEEESLLVNMPLLLPNNPDLKFSHTETEVRIRFTQMTQGSFEVPIEVLQLPEKYNIKIFPESVTLTYHVAVKDYNKVSPPDFRVYANYEDIANKPEARYLNLAIEAYPAFVNYVNFEPKRVEFILTEK